MYVCNIQKYSKVSSEQDQTDSQWRSGYSSLWFSAANCGLYLCLPAGRPASDSGSDYFLVLDFVPITAMAYQKTLTISIAIAVALASSSLLVVDSLPFVFLHGNSISQKLASLTYMCISFSACRSCSSLWVVFYFKTQTVAPPPLTVHFPKYCSQFIWKIRKRGLLFLQFITLAYNSEAKILVHWMMLWC